MAKNKIQFLEGLGIPKFMKTYGTEVQGKKALFWWRWSNGFIRPECGCTGYCEITSRKVYQCHAVINRLRLSAERSSSTLNCH